MDRTFGVVSEARYFWVAKERVETSGSIGFLTFAAWVFSVLAAVMAIDMYALLRTGEFGRSWRVIIIASVIFALTLGLRLCEIVNFRGLEHAGLSQIGTLMVVMALAYAIYLQRQVFARASQLRRRETDTERDVAAMSLRRDFDDPQSSSTGAASSRSKTSDSASHSDSVSPEDHDERDDIEWSRPANAARQS